jgi:hypothetical protein
LFFSGILLSFLAILTWTDSINKKIKWKLTEDSISDIKSNLSSLIGGTSNALTIYDVIINYRNGGNKYIDVIVAYLNNNTSTDGGTKY